MPPLSNGVKNAWNAARLSRGILFASVVIVSFLPLVVFKGLANPYVFGRNMLLRFFAVACVFPLLLLWKRCPETRPRNSALLWGAGTVLLFSFLNAFHGVDTLRSFAGDLERVDGVFTMLVFGIFFLIIQTLLRSGVRWERLWDIQIAVGMLACLLAILRLLAIQTLRLGNPESQLMGTLGNPAFFGEYTLVLLLCAGMRVATSLGKHRWLHGIAASIFLTTAIWSQVRGVFFGVVATAILLCVVYRKAIRGAWHTRTVRGAAPMVVSAMLLVLVLTVAVRAGSFSRIRALAHPFQESTVQQRFLLWRGMSQAFLDRPSFGWGDENQIAAFYAHVPPTLWFYTGEVFDRSHNVLFDILVTGGIFGFACVAGFLFAGWRTI
ncbi:O-antigen ligase family protein, partial [Patescibacteria group bacterium]|nr:O-antigen ligase family protein [Patescibacteria group bacterium]